MFLPHCHGPTLSSLDWEKRIHENISSDFPPTLVKYIEFPEINYRRQLICLSNTTQVSLWELISDSHLMNLIRHTPNYNSQQYKNIDSLTRPRCIQPQINKSSFALAKLWMICVCCYGLPTIFSYNETHEIKLLLLTSLNIVLKCLICPVIKKSPKNNTLNYLRKKNAIIQHAHTTHPLWAIE